MDEETAALLARIDERRRAVGIRSNTALSRAAGLDPGFINDLRKAKKKKLHDDSYIALARVLRCRVEWLRDGHGSPEITSSAQAAAAPAATADAGASILPLAGVCEARVFRVPSVDREIGVVSPGVYADPRFAAAAQALYLVHGPHAEEAGILGDFYVTVLRPDAALPARGAMRTGDLVVVTQARTDGLIERAVRRVGIEAGEVKLTVPTIKYDDALIYSEGSGIIIEGLITSLVKRLQV